MFGGRDRFDGPVELPMKIIHKEQDVISAFCVNQVRNLLVVSFLIVTLNPWCAILSSILCYFAATDLVAKSGTVCCKK